MTNLNKKSKQNIMRTHDKVTMFEKHYNLSRAEAKGAADLLDEHLHYGYTKKAAEVAKRKGIHLKPQSIRNIKIGIIKNVQVFEILLTIARNNQGTVENIKELTQ